MVAVGCVARGRNMWEMGGFDEKESNHDCIWLMLFGGLFLFACMGCGTSCEVSRIWVLRKRFFGFSSSRSLVWCFFENMCPTISLSAHVIALFILKTCGMGSHSPNPDSFQAMHILRL